MGRHQKKRLLNSSSIIGTVLPHKATFTHYQEIEFNFLYCHNMDVWQKIEVDLKMQLKKLKKNENKLKKAS